MDKEAEHNNYQHNQHSRYQQSLHNPHTSALDRLGGKPKEQFVRAREEQVGGRESVEAGKMGSKPDSGICFWCRQEGHHQATCTNPPFCFRCEETGHIAAKCPSNQGCAIHMYGFGFPGQGFYCLKIPGAIKQQPVEHVGLLQIKSGEVTVERLEEELKNLIDSKWAWGVRKLSESEYLATFPSKMMLDTFARSKSVDMALHNISVKVSHSNIDPKVSSVLQTGWVQLSNVPDQARTSEMVTLIAELAGDVVTVDEVSLIKVGPVRVKLRAREVANIKGFIEVFIAGVGYEIKFLAEETKKKTPVPRDPPSPPPKKPDDGDCTDDDDADDLSDFEGEVRRRIGESDAPKRSGTSIGGKSSASQTKQVGGVSQEAERDCQDIGVRGEKVLEVSPLAMYDPATEFFQYADGSQELFSQESNLSDVDTDMANKDELPPNHLLIHTEGGGHRFLAKDKWPVLKLNQATTEGVQQQTKLDTDVAMEHHEAMGGGEVIEDIPSTEAFPDIPTMGANTKWEEFKTSRKKKIKQRKFPVVAERRSDRIAAASSNIGVGGVPTITEIEDFVESW